MLLLTQDGCSLPTALSCCAWENAIVPALNPAAIAVNTSVRFTTGTTAALPTVTAANNGNSVLIHNATAGIFTITPLADALQPGQIATYTVANGVWVRG
jgi:hypothetical protein